MLHHVRDIEQAIFVQGQPAGHGVGFEGSQKPPLLIESLHARLGFGVRLAKVGHQDLIFLVHRDCNRDVELSVAVTVGSPGKHDAGGWRRFVLAALLSPERPRHKRRDSTAAYAYEIPASQFHRTTHFSSRIADSLSGSHGDRLARTEQEFAQCRHWVMWNCDALYRLANHPCEFPGRQASPVKGRGLKHPSFSQRLRPRQLSGSFVTGAFPNCRLTNLNLGLPSRDRLLGAFRSDRRRKACSQQIVRSTIQPFRERRNGRLS